jgi:hypothetical protein
MIKKIVLNILIVVAVVFILDFAIGRILRHFYFTESSGLHFRTTYAIDKAETDILIFGSSRANHHYVPEVFEDSLKMTFYNTGRDGNGVFFQTAVLKSILKRYTPKVIIFDYLGSFAREQEDYDRMSSLLPYYKTHPEIRKIVELRSPYERIKLLSEIYPFNSMILTIAIGNLDMNRKRKPDNKGYIAAYGEWNHEIFTPAPRPLYVVDSNKINAFHEFITQAQESGSKVFVVYSPLFLKFKKSQEIEICNEICSTEKVPFWDFSQDTLFLNHNTLFRDISHLNHKGATIFSSIIASKIKGTLNDTSSPSPD